MKFLLLILMALSAFPMPSAGDGPKRDYWPTNDWRVSAPEEQGMKSAVLEKLTKYVQEKLPKTQSVVVIRHGYITYEKYYSGGPNDPRPIWSATKAILSALVGIAIQQGQLKGLDQKMMDFFPDYTKEKVAKEVYDITIRHLLTMSDGVAGIDIDAFSPSMLSNPARRNPGKEFTYNCASPQIISMIISKSTGMNALVFGKKHLFTPLGMSSVIWGGDSGVTRGCYGMALTPRDLAKLGYLFLNMGVWEGKQVVPAEWIKESTGTRIMVPRDKKYKSAVGKYYIDQYGYYWWVRPKKAHPAYIAWGFGGQLCYVIPDLDCVVIITTTDQETQANMYGHIYLSIIDDYIEPSISRD